MPVSPAIQAARQARYDARMEQARAVVPQGLYCYTPKGPMQPVTLADGTEALRMPTRSCPYWKRRGDKPAQRNGYCRLMKCGDFTAGGRGTMLLWDQVKECGINVDEDDLPTS